MNRIAVWGIIAWGRTWAGATARASASSGTAAIATATWCSTGSAGTDHMVFIAVLAQRGWRSVTNAVAWLRLNACPRATHPDRTTVRWG